MSTFKQEFRCHNFCLGYFRDDLFYLSQWNLPPIVFLIYRFIVSAYVVGCFVYSIVDYEHSDLAKMHNPMAFLTMWSYLMLALHLLLAFINSSTRVICEKRSCLRRPNDEPNFPSYDEYHNLDTAESSSSAGENEVHILSPHTIPWNFKLDWVLFSVCSVAAIMVTTVYFAFLYPDIAKQSKSKAPSVMDINVHAMNSVIVLLEILLAAYPVRLLHFIYPISYGLIYVIFSAIYWSFDHKNNVLYPGVLDWNNPGITCGMVVGIGVSMMILHLIFYGIFRLKIFLYKKCFDIN